MRENPAFVECCYAAHKAGFPLICYLTGRPLQAIRAHDIERWQPFISELLECDRFRNDGAEQALHVRAGIINACKAMFPWWFEKPERKKPQIPTGGKPIGGKKSK